MAFNILIVDDSKTVRAVIRRSLAMARVPTNVVYEATNGAEALEVVAGNWVDLVLADINMPVMNGVELIRRLHADEVTAAIPVVVVSSEGSRSRMEQLEHEGVRGYVRKPFHPEDLRDAVLGILGEGTHGRGGEDGGPEGQGGTR